MSIDFSLNAKKREDQGKGASRRLRRHAITLVPAIVYGAQKAPENITLEHKDLVKALENEAFYTHIIALNVDGKKQDVLIKDVQRHPAKPLIMHMDFLRIDKTQKITLRVPLHFINQDICAGVKTGGGIISHNMSELEIRCLPGDLPEYIPVDMTHVQLNQIVHISDLTLPKGVESVQLSHGASHNLSVAAVHAPKADKAEDAAAAAAAAAAAPAAATPAAAAAPAAAAKKDKK
jgi:large subunit ribosomal protein L25